MSKLLSKPRVAVAPAQLADRLGVAGLLGLSLMVAAALTQVRF